jgi:hypothetical protein
MYRQLPRYARWQHRVENPLYRASLNAGVSCFSGRLSQVSGREASEWLWLGPSGRSERTDVRGPEAASQQPPREEGHPDRALPELREVGCLAQEYLYRFAVDSNLHSWPNDPTLTYESLNTYSVLQVRESGGACEPARVLRAAAARAVLGLPARAWPRSHRTAAGCHQRRSREALACALSERAGEAWSLRWRRAGATGVLAAGVLKKEERRGEPWDQKRCCCCLALRLDEANRAASVQFSHSLFKNGILERCVETLCNAMLTSEIRGLARRHELMKVGRSPSCRALVRAALLLPGRTYS